VVILRRLRGATEDILAICTIGIDIILATELTRRIGTKVLDLGDPWASKVVHIVGLSIPQARVAAAVAAGLLLAAFLLAFKSPTGAWRCARRPATTRPQR